MALSITWPDMERELQRRLRVVDAKLRRATGPEALMLQGRAQLLEELLNMPEAIKTQQTEAEQEIA